jgi:hypothetical protein
MVGFGKTLRHLYEEEISFVGKKMRRVQWYRICQGETDCQARTQNISSALY